MRLGLVMTVQLRPACNVKLARFVEAGGSLCPDLRPRGRRADLILPDRSTALLSPHRSELGHSLTRTLMQAFGSLGARVSQYNSHRPTKRQPV
jgi:hypothetical protein